MIVRIEMRCGHAPIEMKRGELKSAPICPECGERVVKCVTGATPRFTGSCTGPLVQKVQP